jgi:DNA-binding response OmpR family regulator
MAVGADAYVTKPFSTRDLVAQVAGMLAGGP